MESNYTQLQISISDILNENKFVIPQFQRNVVWKKGRRKEFISNVRNGDPFGVILVRLNNDKYELIDGLQRISTIKSYLATPFEYLDKDDVNISLIEKLIKKRLELLEIPCTEEYLKNELPKIQKHIFSCLKGNLEVWETIESFRDLGYPSDREVNKTINEICSKFYEDVDIKNLQIFAINYTGPEENIPNVFYNLNTGGVTLSKYETYAALWYNTLYKVNDEEILSQIENKYENLREKSDLDVNFSLDSLRSDGISLFEYCYALSGILRDSSKDFDKIVGTNSKSTDPLGFEILSLVLGLNVNKADSLYALLKEKKPEFLVKIKNIIKDSLSQITKILKPTVIGLGKQPLCSDSTYMFYHILISYIRQNYEINVESETVSNIPSPLKFNDLKKYLPLHYIHDVLSDFWKINRQVSDLTREINNNNSRTKYWHNISVSKWEIALSSFIEQQLTSTKNIPYKNKVFIDFLMKLRLIESPNHQYNLMNKELSHEKYNLDFEHIVPRKIIEQGIGDLTTSQQNIYPISSIGNLCYLTSKDNRSKKEKTIFEYQEDRPAYTYNDDFLNFIMYPSENELRFLKYSNKEFRIHFEDFLSHRVNQLEKEFLRLIKKYY